MRLVVYNFDDDGRLENAGTAHRIAKTDWVTEDEAQLWRPAVDTVLQSVTSLALDPMNIVRYFGRVL